ncbi:hypothetical protein Q8A73_012848 [Channa argus]|nr:hypothetical protein Q8A73_012848 [Channa argus]
MSYHTSQFCADSCGEYNGTSAPLPLKWEAKLAARMLDQLSAYQRSPSDTVVASGVFLGEVIFKMMEGFRSVFDDRMHYLIVSLAVVPLSHCIREALTAGTSDRSKKEELEDCRRLLCLAVADTQTVAGCASAHLNSQHPACPYFLYGFSPSLEPLTADI